MRERAEAYPRGLRPVERELILRVLPADAPGYAPYRAFVEGASVIGPGRRGEGEIVLGKPGDRPDPADPLTPVVSFGAGEAGGDDVSVTLREIADGRMSVEIVGRRIDRIPDDAAIARFWTYAEWLPGKPCPQCGGRAREVDVVPPDAEGRRIVLVVCAADRRIWIHDGPTGISRPVPVTNYYNELMLLKHVRDPAVALSSRRLFDDPAGHSDADLAAAFVAYNRVRAKVELPAALAGAVSGTRGPLRRLLDAVNLLLRR